MPVRLPFPENGSIFEIKRCQNAFKKMQLFDVFRRNTLIQSIFMMVKD